MIQTFILTAMAAAGTAVLWRNWLEDHKNHKEFIVRRIGGLHKALTCGSCFTYWLALALTLVLQPLEGWEPLMHATIALPVPLLAAFSILAEWMALSWLAVFLRFLYVALQELVNYQVHTLREHGH